MCLQVDLGICRIHRPRPKKRLALREGPRSFWATGMYRPPALEYVQCQLTLAIL
jgi:hypothetical protein